MDSIAHSQRAGRVVARIPDRRARSGGDVGEIDHVPGRELSADGDAEGIRTRLPRPSMERWLPRGVIRPPWTSDSMVRKESVLGEADGTHAAA